MYYNFECACVSSLISENRLSPQRESLIYVFFFWELWPIISVYCGPIYMSKTSRGNAPEWDKYQFVFIREEIHLTFLA